MGASCDLGLVGRAGQPDLLDHLLLKQSTRRSSPTAPKAWPPAPTSSSRPVSDAGSAATPAKPARGGPGRSAPSSHLTARPAITRDRVQPGHWEGDLIIGANNQSALAVLVGRMSRYTLLVGLPLGYRAADLLTGLQARLRSIVPDLRRTLTWDQGGEMAAWPDLERLTGLDCYFCQPHSPWQKGTVENTNRILRRHLPRGLALARIPTSQLRQIETNINTMPRRLHEWRTAHDLLSPHLVATAA